MRITNADPDCSELNHLRRPAPAHRPMAQEMSKFINTHNEATAAGLAAAAGGKLAVVKGPPPVMATADAKAKAKAAKKA